MLLSPGYYIPPWPPLLCVSAHLTVMPMAPPPAEAKKDTHANVHFSLTRGEGGGGTQTSPGNCARGS
jgi:hypothetical protein